ncbi:MAG: hypothetical protein HY287_02490 [Planctomycetes bacterium]|nr:hypothetical protein [Planctomycetota bacterium]MBI3833178.1 hypothetical protein [Planctomycetota bacterium]
MPKRLSKSTVTSDNRNVNQTAADTTKGRNGSKKNRAAVTLGRLGGLKGGRARAAKLSAAKRTSIARKAAKARWKKRA